MDGIEIRLVTEEDAALFDAIADEVFDHPIRPDSLRSFLDDPRHHMVVARDGDTLVGFVASFVYLNPDKLPEMFVNEIGVTPTHRRRGIGKALMQTMLAHSRKLGCRYAWIGTELDNDAARALYRSTGGKEDTNVVFYEYTTG